jgi:hypothetical protein
LQIQDLVQGKRMIEAAFGEFQVKNFKNSMMKNKQDII